jgi:ketosteroid isomerase-like protein
MKTASKSATRAISANSICQTSIRFTLVGRRALVTVGKFGYRLAFMKTALVLLMLCVPAFAAESAAEKEIAIALDSWKHAMVKGDAAALTKLYHADLTYVHSGGKYETKAEAIAASTKPGSLAKAVEVHHATTRVYGNTGIVNAKVDITNAAGETSHLDMLLVWLKSPAGWQLTARHALKLP